ncbi:MAG: metal-sensing transcriptional repressor [Lachnospiraceae bacterium]
MSCSCSISNENDSTNKVKHREESELKALVTRLNKVEGQIRGIRQMVESERYCVDILTQVSAVQSALNSFNKELLARHIHSCVKDDIREGSDEAVDELCELLKKLMK